MSDATAFAWTDHYLLGYPPMDTTHREFVELVNALLTVPDTEVSAQLARFAVHAERHFEEERASMAGSAFPAMDCHVDEHAAVLKSVVEVSEILAAGGQVKIARDLAQALMDWFPRHADYMDASLAQWLVKQRQGGTPVVLRRGIIKT